MDRQKRKFERCRVRRNGGSKFDEKKTEVNLSNRQLSSDETSVLAKGEKFACASMPMEDNISNVEAGIHGLSIENADEIQQEETRILRKAVPPKNNLTSGECRALINLEAVNNFVILLAGNSSATVVMNTADYKQKIRDGSDPVHIRC